LGEIDESIRKTLELILNVALQGDQHNQATLPFRWGGLAIRKLTDIALPGYLSSINAYKHLLAILTPCSVECHDSICSSTLAKFLDNTEHSDDLPFEVLADQQKLDDIICSSKYNDIFHDGDKIEKARLMAAADTSSSKWLQTIPSENLGTKLSNSATRLGVAIRLGADVNKVHSCRCGGQVDLKGRHGLSCTRSAGRQMRHSNINDIISRALTTAGIPNVREINGLGITDAKRPDGMTLIPFARGQAMIWDVTVSDLFASSYVAAAAKNPGETANAAEIRKVNKYNELASSYLVQAIAFDTMGVPGKDTRALMKDLGKRLQLATGEIRAGEFLAQRLSVEIIRSNAVSIMGTYQESGPPWQELEFIN
jgi:hypothetical protein